MLLEPGITAPHHAWLKCSKMATHAEPDQPEHISTNWSAFGPSHGHKLLRLPWPPGPTHRSVCPLSYITERQAKNPDHPADDHYQGTLVNERTKADLRAKDWPAIDTAKE